MNHFRTVSDTAAPLFVDRLPEAVPAPEVTYKWIDLPKTRLHYIECGNGPPLVIVPATISRVENWKALTQFMGQVFTAYFFELPGHGESTAFPEPFTSDLVAEAVEDFIDRMGHDRITLMGFSFGGILAMKTLERLGERVEQVIMISPATSQQTLCYTGFQRRLIDWTGRLLRRQSVRRRFVRLIHGRRSAPLLARMIRRLGNVEDTIDVNDVFFKISETTCEVLAYQIGEVLQSDFRIRPLPYKQPCYFAMSVNDPMLSFVKTRQIIQGQFENVMVEMFDFPYHQAPDPLTFEGLNVDYAHFLTLMKEGGVLYR